MGPTSVALVMFLVAALGGLIALLVLVRRLAVQVTAALLVGVLGFLLGLVGVNDHYGYYRSWSAFVADVRGGQAVADLANNGSPSASSGTVVRAAHWRHNGRVEVVDIGGGASGVSRHAFVYLPPQYFERAFSSTRFPVVELIHGSPGGPSDWLTSMNVVKAADLLVARQLMGPMVLVMPQMNGGGPFQDCVNGVKTADDTYISSDVPAWVRAHLRVTSQPAEWGIAGYSSGGYCAANLALRHRGSFGAAAAMDGYFRAVDGPAANVLASQSADTANSPLLIAESLRPGVRPLPAMWVAAGTGSATDVNEAQAFVDAMRRLEAVTFITEPGAVHNYYDWTASLPSMLAWMWQQIAPPAMKVEFPIAGPPSEVRIQPGTPPSHHVVRLVSALSASHASRVG